MAIRFYYLALRERGRPAGRSLVDRLLPRLDLFSLRGYFFYGPARVIDAPVLEGRISLARVGFATIALARTH